MKITKQFEGCRLKAYPDPGSGDAPWTIGYGHTRGVNPGDTCTQAQADKWLDEDLAIARNVVDVAVMAPLTKNQDDALTDFVFNVGAKNFLSSTLLAMLNTNNYEAAANQFDKWIYAAGKVLPGLIKRRAAEKALFLMGDV